MTTAPSPPTPQRPDALGTVLAVDDCPATREIMRASLEGLGYRVQAVDSGWAALEAVEAHAFDVIVLDVEMPGMDGMTLGRALRHSPATAGTAIAMHSSVHEAEVRAGFDGYDLFVGKSGDVRQLGQQVDRLVRSRRVRPGASQPGGEAA